MSGDSSATFPTRKRKRKQSYRCDDDYPSSDSSDLPESVFPVITKKRLPAAPAATQSSQRDKRRAAPNDAPQASSTKTKDKEGRSSKKRAHRSTVKLGRITINSDGEDIEEPERRKTIRKKRRNNPAPLENRDHGILDLCPTPSPVRTREENGAIVIISSDEEDLPPASSQTLLHPSSRYQSPLTPTLIDLRPPSPPEEVGMYAPLPDPAPLIEPDEWETMPGIESDSGPSIQVIPARASPTPQPPEVIYELGELQAIYDEALVRRMSRPQRHPSVRRTHKCFQSLYPQNDPPWREPITYSRAFAVGSIKVHTPGFFARSVWNGGSKFSFSAVRSEEEQGECKRTFDFGVAGPSLGVEPPAGSPQSYSPYFPPPPASSSSSAAAASALPPIPPFATSAPPQANDDLYNDFDRDPNNDPPVTLDFSPSVIATSPTISDSALSLSSRLQVLAPDIHPSAPPPPAAEEIHPIEEDEGGQLEDHPQDLARLTRSPSQPPQLQEPGQHQHFDHEEQQYPSPSSPMLVTPQTPPRQQEEGEEEQPELQLAHSHMSTGHSSSPPPQRPQQQQPDPHPSTLSPSSSHSNSVTDPTPPTLTLAAFNEREFQRMTQTIHGLKIPPQSIGGDEDSIGDDGSGVHWTAQKRHTLVRDILRDAARAFRASGLAFYENGLNVVGVDGVEEPSSSSSNGAASTVALEQLELAPTAPAPLPPLQSEYDLDAFLNLGGSEPDEFMDDEDMSLDLELAYPD